MNFWNSLQKVATWSAASYLFFQRFLEIVSIFILDNKHLIIYLIIPFITDWKIIYFANDFWMLCVALLITGIVIFIFASSLRVERAGRREHLSISDSVMAVCLGTLAFYFWLQEHGVDVSSYNLIPFISLEVYINMFALGFGPIPGVTIGEVLSPGVIGLAIGIMCLCASLVQFCVVKTYQVLLDAARGYELTDFEAFKRRFAAVFTPSGVLNSPEPREVVVAVAPRTIETRLDTLEEAVRVLKAQFADVKQHHQPRNHAATIQPPTILAPEICSTTPSSSWCYYHIRYGKDARKCSSNLCTFSPKIVTQNQIFKKLYTSDKPSKFTYPCSTRTVRP